MTGDFGERVTMRISADLYLDLGSIDEPPNVTNR